MLEKDNPLKTAIEHCEPDILKILIDSGLYDVHDVSARGATLLMTAAWWGHNECVELLIDAGADVNAKDNEGASVLKFAKINDNNLTIHILIQAGAKE